MTSQTTMRILRTMMFAALIAIGSLAQPAIAQKLEAQRRVKPELWLTDAARWMAPDDNQRRIKVHVLVGPKGSITSCDVTVPSGAARLDQAVCVLLFYNARYNTMTDEAGSFAAFEDNLSFLINPRPLPPISYPVEALRRSEQGTVVVTLDMGADGKPQNCRIKQSSHSPSLDSTTCKIMMVMDRRIPPVNAAGAYIPFTVDEQMNWEIPK